LTLRTLKGVPSDRFDRRRRVRRMCSIGTSVTIEAIETPAGQAMQH
jgi:hypothetical protein